MKVLVTGSAGFIGSHLVRELSKRHSVIEFDIKRSQSQDVRSLEAVMEAAKAADAIVHLAALCLDAESVQKPLEYFTTNVVGTFNVLEAARQLGIRTMLNASSAATGGSTPYGVSKLCGEKLCESYAKTYGIRTASLRFCNVYGGDNDKGVVFEFFNRIKAGKPVIVHDDGEYVRDYVHVRDVVATIEKFLAGEFEPAAYDVGTGIGTTVNELVKAVGRATGRKIEVEHEKTSYSRVRTSVAKAPCVAHPVALERGLREYWDSVKGE